MRLSSKRPATRPRVPSCFAETVPPSSRLDAPPQRVAALGEGRSLSGGCMCSLDYDGVCDVWRETPRIARVQHACDGCGTIIPPRAAYLAHAHVYDGSAGSESMCFCCWWAREEFRASPEHRIIPTPRYLWRDVEDCIDGDRSSPWRPLLAGIKARWRVSPSGRARLARREAAQ